MDNLQQLLSEAKLSSLVESQEIVLLEHNQTVADALKTLARHNILSAPLVVSPGLEDVESLSPGESAPQLLGWLDVKDIIKAFLAFLHEHKGPVLPANMLALMTELEKHGPAFAAKMLITVLGSEDRGLVYQTDTDASVLTAIRDMFLGQRDGGRLVHRLAIFDAHGDITHIVSHVDVLRFLLKHQQHLGPAAGQSLQQLGLLGAERTGALVLLEPATPTLLAYEKLAAAGVTGAPVLSSDGQIIANLSASDIRGIQTDHFGVLALPVAEFLAVKHGTSYLGYSQHSSKGAAHPFFASRLHKHEQQPMRTTGADSADAADAEQAASDGAAAAAPAAAAGGAESLARTGSGAAPGSDRKQPPHSPKGKDLGASEDVPLITCSSSATLLEVLQVMCDNVVHRVYVVEKGAKPHEVVGVVTPTDILALVAGLGSWDKAEGAMASKRAGGGSSRQEEGKKPKVDEAEAAADEAAAS
uniref:CBS domain-containing protein n=1 Tax=Tetradesmus obliquus TaxID=3088 RepID=A0A383VM92_TETOB|eukprot:jgi/Sobl393_1/15442/SZX65862.1